MTTATPLPTTMNAIVQDEYDASPEAALRLGRLDVPEAGEGEVLVRVAASSVDRGTWHVMAGLPLPIRVAGFGVRHPKFSNPGRSLSGTVATVGAGVSGFAPGDRVYGIAPGAFAEFAVVEAKKLALMPASLSFEQAAAVPISGLTALQAVRDHGQVKAGQRVLVTGASGGVGSFAVQIAKALGAEVTGVSSAAKMDAVRANGADHVLDYASQDFADGGLQYDVIIDIAGNRRIADLRRALTAKGRLVITGGETDGRWLGGSDRQIRAMMLSPFVSQKLGTFVASENAADLVAFAELMDSGQVTAAVDRAYPLAETSSAIRDLLDGNVRGKLVIAVGSGR
jgi:NADPH:quinone reductase-like Zn-dependent oxidoreductase